MKIIIHSLDELLQLTALIHRSEPVREGARPESEAERYVSSGQFAAELAHAESAAGYDDQPGGLPTDIPVPLAGAMDAAVAETSAALRQEVDPTLDADGVVHSTDWHSEPAKINADGRWKARRGRDNDAYKAWLREQSVFTDGPIDAADAEPVATETHALPVHSTDSEMDAALVEDAAKLAALGADPGPTLSDLEELQAPSVSAIDLAALVEASQEAALNASDSHMDLIKACQSFISDHGHPAYNALKAAVAPLEGAENGKAVPQFTPAERRLMRACIENYPKS